MIATGGSPAAGLKNRDLHKGRPNVAKYSGDTWLDLNQILMQFRTTDDLRRHRETVIIGIVLST